MPLQKHLFPLGTNLPTSWTVTAHCAQSYELPKDAMRARIVASEDFVTGRCIGMGTFSSVFEAKPRDAAYLRLQSSDTKSLDTSSSHADETEGACCSAVLSTDSHLTPQRTRKTFALKKLNDEALAHPEIRELASRDLAIEASILSQLPPHENVVTLCAISSDFWEGDKPEHGFLVLDHLSETLHQRLCRWRTYHRQSSTCSRCLPFIGMESHKRRGRQRQFQMERVRDIGLPIARAMVFLHKQGICYRDLKPHNVGWDEESGTYRLFDFGLARRVSKSETEDEEGDGGVANCRLTGMTGSLRYMAPEVVQNEPYGLPVDVYSFSILLWEVFTLDRAYADYSASGSRRSASCIYHHVASRNRCPPLGPTWDSSLRRLLERGWHPDPSRRPSFEQIVGELEALRG